MEKIIISKDVKFDERVVGIIESRDGTIMDVVRKKSI